MKQKSESKYSFSFRKLFFVYILAITMIVIAGPVSDAGIKYLKSLSKLNKINLRRTSVTSQGIKQLKKTFPKITIYR